MNKQTLQILYQTKGIILKKYLIKNGCTKEDAEDIVQETFIKALTYMVHLEEENFVAWLFKVALHKCYDLCRKNKRHPQIEINEEQFIDDLYKEDGLSYVLKHEKGQTVKEILDQMNPTYKNLLIMKYEVELSYEDIGQLLDMKPTKVKTYLQRARESFKKLWKGNNYE